MAEKMKALPAGSVDAQTAGISHSGDLSMWDLFMQADLVVKLVMFLLAMASVWSWTIIFEKGRTLKRLNKRANKFEEAFWSGESLDKLYQRVRKGVQDPIIAIFCAGMEEWHNAVKDGLPNQENLQASLRQRVDRIMAMTINREMNVLERGMTFLASVGSTSPFIGLFGTVWGIMNSFSAIAGSNNTSLAVVAPGIAEALFATALGLVAAIPAVLAFNVNSSRLDNYADRLEGFSAEFSSILTRHLESQGLVTDAKSTKKAA